MRRRVRVHTLNILNMLNRVTPLVNMSFHRFMAWKTEVIITNLLGVLIRLKVNLNLGFYFILLFFFPCILLGLICAETD